MTQIDMTNSNDGSTESVGVDPETGSLTFASGTTITASEVAIAASIYEFFAAIPAEAGATGGGGEGGGGDGVPVAAGDSGSNGRGEVPRA